MFCIINRGEGVNGFSSHTHSHAHFYTLKIFFQILVLSLTPHSYAWISPLYLLLRRVDVEKHHRTRDSKFWILSNCHTLAGDVISDPHFSTTRFSLISILVPPLHYSLAESGDRWDSVEPYQLLCHDLKTKGMMTLILAKPWQVRQTSKWISKKNIITQFPRRDL